MTKYKISINQTIRDSVKVMDKAGIGFCVCVDNEDKVIGVLSDGDFRRAVLRGESLDSSVNNILNRDFIYLTKNYSNKDIENIFLNSAAQHIPILDEGYLIEIITEEQYFGLERSHKFNNVNLDCPAVIMAGGKGKRMDPFTRVLPKALIPIRDEPICKVIMDDFYKKGVSDFYITLNDKGQMIKAYFHDHELPYEINYIDEKIPLGTAGALKFLFKKINKPIFVSNCDILMKIDYLAFYNFHINNAYDLTLVASMKNYIIPYGVCDISENGELHCIDEKPEYDLLVNTGLYLINPELLKLIPDNQYYDMTTFINLLKKNKYKVGVFPVSEMSWSDYGQWPEYYKSLDK